MSLIVELSVETGLSVADVHRVIHTAPARYKIFPIQKRQGGVRIIAQPSRELKAFQRYVAAHKLSELPIHAASTAYSGGNSIRKNAERHKDGRHLLKLDFTDFFPSIKSSDWERYVKQGFAPNLIFDELRFYTKILFWSQERKSIVPRCLSIGAPSSPLLSNILLFELDRQLTAEAIRLDVVYTRYADDISISSQERDTLEVFERRAIALVRRLKSPKLAFNAQKRGLYSRGDRRTITGLNVTPQGQISIGRDRKRMISAMLHRLSLGNLDADDKAQLKGLLGFSISCEPELMARLRSKYGDDLINSALTYHVPRRAQP